MSKFAKQVYQVNKILNNKQDLHNINTHTNDVNPLMFTQIIVQKQKYGWTDGHMTDGWTDTWTANVKP